MPKKLTPEVEEAVRQIADKFDAKRKHMKYLQQIALEGNIDAITEVKYQDLQIDILINYRSQGTFVQYALHNNNWNFIAKIAQQYKTHIQADIQDKAKFGEALRAAVMTSRIRTVEQLLEAGAGKCSSNHGDSLLRLAVQNRCEPIVDLLFSYDFELSTKNKKTLIELASDRHEWECIETMARQQKTDSEDKAGYGYALLAAVCNNRVETAKLLLEAGASKHSRGLCSGDTALHKAVRKNNVAMLDLLLSFGCDLTLENADKKTPIQLAAKLKRWNLVEAIAKKQKTDADDKARYGLILYDAVIANRSETVKLLLEAGAKENLKQEQQEGQSRENCSPVKTLMNNFYGMFHRPSKPKDFMAFLEENLKKNYSLSR